MEIRIANTSKVKLHDDFISRARDARQRTALTASVKSGRCQPIISCLNPISCNSGHLILFPDSLRGCSQDELQSTTMLLVGSVLDFRRCPDFLDLPLTIVACSWEKAISNSVWYIRL